jgi:hypothetical protein
MNFLQIWIGNKPAKILMTCIESVLSQVTDKDTYTLIGTINFLKNNKKVKYINVNDYLKKYPEINMMGNIGNSFQSDLIRFHYAYNNSNVFYVDCDVELEKINNNDFTKDLFSRLNSCHYDIFMFYSPGKSELIKKLIDFNLKIMKNGNKPFGGFYVPYLSKFLNNVNELKTNHLHLRYSRKTNNV